VDASLVEGQSGPTVGYVLARPADEIRLLDVVQAIEGDREFDPLLPVHPRQRTAVRRLNALARRQHNAQRALLKRLTLAQLLEG
jgi:DNA-binding IscR family transcriptional regulator